MLIKLLLSAGIVYCFACYAITLLPFTFCREEGDETSEYSRYFHAVWEQAPIRMFLTVLFILIPLFLVMIPLIMPFCAVQCYLEARREKAEMLRKHHDYGFVWTNLDDLPSETRKFFDLRTPELLELGFQLDGFYLMKPNPANYYGALFLNESGTTVASLTHIFDNYFFGFSSILESGRAIDTSPIEATPDLLRFADHPRITALFVPDQTICAGWQRHQEKLAELYWTTGDRVLAFEANQVCDVLQYEGRVFSEALFELGDHDEAPPAAVLPPALPLAWEVEYPLFPEPDALETPVEVG